MLKASGVSSKNCNIYRYDCANKNHARKIEKLRNVVSNQEAEFLVPGQIDVKPWDNQCKMNYSMYIATNDTYTDVCGWMMVIWTTYAHQKYVHVHEIATKAATNPEYRGIGRAILTVLEKDMQSEGYHFIKLFALDQAADIYTHLGYSRILNSKTMYKKVTRPPSKRFIRSKMRNGVKKRRGKEDDREIDMNDIKEILEDALDADDMERVTRIARKKPHVMDDFVNIVSAYNDDHDALRQELHNLLDEIDPRTN